MHTPEGLRSFYLRAISQIVHEDAVETCTIEALRWGEVDFPADLERVTAMAERF